MIFFDGINCLPKYCFQFWSSPFKDLIKEVLQGKKLLIKERMNLWLKALVWGSRDLSSDGLCHMQHWESNFTSLYSVGEIQCLLLFILPI